ncbi:lipoprotein-releasing ABC transporter permease subunit [Inmirania thermothiophila]|uniref:Lipoprotein-releasing system permease protein n=1 Tax=Inmirania thermothiophila TaxID=1750597 RepID=A0A3N1Y4W2_9GAMM|nr:lipoprotein-releasing ABC transporter permease subunit [Inmirania thermothiophila]ROR32662.1 lipoprotein-releasing system permease protein [Inmirania thermothiophila]
MFRPVELWIGLRYTRSRRRNGFISFISLTSIAGIALGITALITVLSVMNGFERELRARILAMTAHATIRGYGAPLADWPQVLEHAAADPRVAGAAPFVRVEAMLSSGQAVAGAIVRGIDPALEPRVSEVARHMAAGTLADLVPGGWGIVLGRELAAALGVAPGDKVTVVVPQVQVTAAGFLPRLRRFTVVGLFGVGMYEYDRGLALIHIDDARRLLRLGDAVTGVRLRLHDLFEAPRVVRDIARALPGAYLVSDWTREHANFFRAVRTEKRVMFVILTLIVAVAAFNIVSTLVMVVTDKASQIAILRTLGASPASILAVFVIQGALIGAVGTALGIAGGVALALNVETLVPAVERALGVQFLPADVYYISELPSELRAGDVVRIGGVAFALSLLATLYPAWRAARVRPAQALRHE